MGNKILSAISMLLAAAILTSEERASAQTAFSAPGDAAVERRCSSIVLASDTPLLPLRLILPYLEQREDFKASRLVLTDEPELADATVTLSQSGERDTHIAVFSRISGRQVSALSIWTDYPGMVAADVMEQLKVVCPLSGTVASRQRMALAPTAVGFRQPIAPGFVTAASRPPAISASAGAASEQPVEPGFSSSNPGDSQQENKCAAPALGKTNALVRSPRTRKATASSTSWAEWAFMRARFWLMR